MTWKSLRRCCFRTFYIHKSIYETCSTYVSTEDMRLKLKTKRGFSRLQGAQKYCRTAKDVLQLIKVILTAATKIFMSS